MAVKIEAIDLSKLYNNYILHDSDNQIPAITTDDELEKYLISTFNIAFSKYSCCPSHTSPWQIFCDAYFARYPVIVVKGSRGLSGKSYLLATLGLVEAITLKTDVTILGGTGQQSQRVHDYQRKLWNNDKAPKDLLKSDPGLWKTELTNGATIIALMASQGAVRGPHPARLREDEVDEMDYAIFEASLGETMPQNGVEVQTLIASTHQYPNGTFTEILKRAKERGWPIYEVCYKENLAPNGWLAQSTVDQKRNEVSSLTWDVEYELQQPIPQLASRVFSVPAIQRARLGLMQPLEHYEDDLARTDLYQFPIVGRRYCAFIDPSAGYETPDRAICDVLDVRTGILVATIAGHYPPEMITEKGIILCKRFNNAFLAIEGNGPLGGYAIHKAEDLGYYTNEVFYFSDWEIAQSKHIKPEKPGFFTTGTNKGTIIGDLSAAFTDGSIIVMDSEHLDEMSAFIQHGRQLEAANGFHDDMVMALAGAHYLRSLPFLQNNRPTAPVPPSVYTRKY